MALDQACIDIINNMKISAPLPGSEGDTACDRSGANDPTDLLSRIDKQHGVHTIEWAEKIGLGTRKYRIVSIDK